MVTVEEPNPAMSGKVAPFTGGTVSSNCHDAPLVVIVSDSDWLLDSASATMNEKTDAVAPAGGVIVIPESVIVRVPAAAV
jgi:hypothetical protein